jgi:hypothetical protein
MPVGPLSRIHTGWEKRDVIAQKLRAGMCEIDAHCTDETNELEPARGSGG